MLERFRPIDEQPAKPEFDESALGLLKEAAAAAMHSAVVEPLGAVRQLFGMEAAKPRMQAEFGTASWYAQTVGSGFGMVVPFLLTQSATSALCKRTAMARGLGKSVMDGAVYGAVFSPSLDAGSSVLEQRVVNAFAGGLTFGTQSAAAHGMMVGWEKLLGNQMHNYALRIGTNMIAGAAAGVVSAESHSLLSGHGFARAEDVKRSIASFIVTGGALDAFHIAREMKAEPVTASAAGIPESIAVKGIQLSFDGGIVKNENLTRVSIIEGPNFEKTDGIWLKDGRDQGIANIVIDSQGDILVQSTGSTSRYSQIVPGGVTPVQDFYDLYKGENLEYYFRDAQTFAMLEGSPAFAILQARQDRVVLALGLEALERHLPEVTKEENLAEVLSIFLADPVGREAVLNPERFEQFVPQRCWRDSSGAPLTRMQAYEAIASAASNLAQRQSELDFSHVTARKIAEHIVPQSIINSGKGDVFDDHVQYSTQRQRDVVRVASNPEKFMGFHLPLENAPILKEIWTRQQCGHVPAEFGQKNRADGTIEYSVKSWRPATEEEMILPLSELTKTLKIIDFGFKDGNGNPTYGKVSLGIHDAFDHLALFREMRRMGMFSENREGRGYRAFMKELGFPQATDMFNREAELLASIGFEWRAFSIMPSQYDPPISIHAIRQFVSAPRTANQREALAYVADLCQRDPAGTSREARLLRHQFYTVDRELKEQERQTGLTLVPENQALKQLTIGHPEYAALIIDLTRVLGDPMDPSSKYVRLASQCNLLYEEYLQKAARGQWQPSAVPTNEALLLLGNGAGITPLSTQRWLEAHMGYNSRRAAVRNSTL